MKSNSKSAYPDDDRRLPVPDVHRGVRVVSDAPRNHIPEDLQIFNGVEPMLGDHRAEGDPEQVGTGSWVGPAPADRVHVALRRASTSENEKRVPVSVESRDYHNNKTEYYTHLWSRWSREDEQILGKVHCQGNHLGWGDLERVREVRHDCWNRPPLFSDAPNGGNRTPEGEIQSVVGEVWDEAVGYSRPVWNDFVGELYERYGIERGHIGVESLKGSEAVGDTQAVPAQLYLPGPREREFVLNFYGVVDEIPDATT